MLLQFCTCIKFGCAKADGQCAFYCYIAYTDYLHFARRHQEEAFAVIRRCVHVFERERGQECGERARGSERASEEARDRAKGVRACVRACVRVCVCVCVCVRVFLYIHNFLGVMSDIFVL